MAYDNELNIHPRGLARALGEVLTASEVAAALKVSPQTIARPMTAGKLPGVRIGSAWRYSRARLEHFLATGEVAHGEKKPVSTAGDV
jgi:excisionase family DNA binding protein